MVCTWIITFQALADLTCFITRSEHLDLKIKMYETSAREWQFLSIGGAKKDARILDLRA